MDLPTSLEQNWPPSDWKALNLLVAVSGGADSMALLRAIWMLKQQLGGPGEITAVHLNHQLRGKQSDEDEQWLAEQCEGLGIRFVARRINVAGKAAEEGDGLESAARDLRYRALTELAHELGARFVVTAHHRDDQVETILFRLLRGTGLRGLRGMSRSRYLSPSVTLVRPLLTSTRAEIRGYLETINQPFREDASNQDNLFARNRLRNELLPHLREAFNQGIDKALLRLSVQASEAHEVIEQHARELYEQALADSDSESTCPLVLKVGAFRDRPDALVIEVLRFAWREAGLPEQGMSDTSWRVLAELAQPNSRQRHTLPGNLLAECDGRELRVFVD